MMDAFDENSDTGSSQASQMVRDLCEPAGSMDASRKSGGADTVRRSGDTRSGAKYAEPPTINTGKFLSMDLLPSSRSSGSAPHYHFHGLATTQTQTQTETPQLGSMDDNEASQGSHKENIDTNGGHASPPSSRPGSPHASSSSKRNTSSRLPHKDQPSHSNLLTNKAISSKTTLSVALQPPSLKSPINTSRAKKAAQNKSSHGRSHTYTTTRKTTKSRSRSKSRESSIDSFGGAPSEDPAEAFISRAKQFDVPLRELGRVGLSSEDTIGDAQVPPKTLMFNSPDSLPSSSRLRGPSTPEGRVLVESTPSHSQTDTSLAATQLLDDSQQFPSRQPDYIERMAIHRDADANSSHSLASSSPPSNYGKFLAGEDSQSSNILKLELQPTQPSTQQDDTELSNTGAGPTTNWRAGGTDDMLRPTNATITSVATTSTAPRTILSLVDPKKHWKYLKYQDQGMAEGPNNRTEETNTSRTTASRWVATQPSLEGHMSTSGHAIPFNPRSTTSEWQETQPSNDQPSPKHFDGPEPIQGIPILISSRNSIQMQTTSPGRSMEINDGMEIVPDSEPACEISVEPHQSHATTSFTSPQKLARKKGLLKVTAQTHLATVNESIEDSRLDEACVVDEGKKEAPAQVEEEIEDADEDEDDIPLATRAAKKGKKKSEPKLKTPAIWPAKGTRTKFSNVIPKGRTTEKESVKTNVPAQRKVAEVTTNKFKKPALGNRSWDTGEVPSSVPEQDLANTRIGRTVNSSSATSSKDKRINSKSTPKIVKKPSTQERRKTDAGAGTDVEDESELYEKQKKSRIQDMLDGDDDGTESADDLDEEYMEVDLNPPSSRKRKREPRQMRATTTRHSKFTKGQIATPVTRQVKRLKSGLSSNASRNINTDPTRVFALWKQDGHYYSGVVHSHQESGRYLIKFDDGTDATVTLEQIRLCEVRVGDDVLTANNSRSSKVVNVDEDEVHVRVDNKVQKVNLADVRIANKTILHAWKDRLLTPDDIVTMIRPAKIKLSPTPSKSSLYSAQSNKSNRKKILTKTALIVTLNAGAESWGKDKETLMHAVRSSGGLVIDDLTSIIRMDGKHSLLGNRWVIKKSDAQWIGKDGVERLFLLADDANQKPKFLIALALGIPCLSTSWLHDSVNEGVEKDWQGYMLPQGYSEALGARPSQQVDIDWGNSIHQLTDIMSNPVACKLFEDKSILCVGQEMVPQPKGKRLSGFDEKSQEAINAVTRIILAMGAERVEAVTEIKYASENIESYDYVVIREAFQYSTELAGGNTVLWSWVKDCLIASRYLPLPEWDQVHSQEM